MLRPLRLLAPALAIVAAAGCGTPVTAPPLTLRPIEQQPVLLPAATAEPEVAADPALAMALAAQVDVAAAGDRRFQPLREQAGRAVAAAHGAAAGSEAWTVAQQALTALDASRGPVRDASIAIEALRQEPANAGSGARAAVSDAAERVEALERTEAAAVAMLSARLR